jgi:hypothetical protein
MILIRQHIITLSAGVRPVTLKFSYLAEVDGVGLLMIEKPGAASA